MKKFGFALLLALMCVLFLGNTPGKPVVTLTWTETTPGVTFNVYRGATTGVCNGNPTPFALGVTALTYDDNTVIAGQAYFYAVSAVKGVESACSPEAQVSVPSAPATPGNLQGTTH